MRLISLVPSVLHLSHGFQCSPTLNRQPYEGRLPLTSWWKKIVKHDSWPIQHDILSPPLLRLTTMVSTEPLSHGTGTPRCLQKEMATYKHWSVSLWRDPDDVPHCRILSPDKTEWRLISATLCGWKRCFVAPPVMVNDTHTRRRRLIVPHRIIMKLVHFPLTGGLLHLVQRWGDWAGL